MVRGVLGPWVYPALLLGHFAAYFLIAQLGLPLFTCYGVVATSLLLILFALERVRPYRRAWQIPDGQTRLDTLHLVVGSILGGWAGRLATQLVLLACLGSPSTESTRWPFVLRFLLGLGAVEIGRFLWHYSQHHVDVLWRLHRLHHDAERVTALKSGRAHLVSYGLQAISTALPVLVLGLGHDVLAACVCLQGLVGILAHANVDFDERWVRAVLQSPSVHRLHHRRPRGPREKVNLAATFNVLDRIAGTFEAPDSDAEPYETGVGTPVVTKLSAQLLLRDR